MISYKSGDILQEEAEALVNTVNCVGVMGRGIALQFKNAFPANFRAYEAACKGGEVQPGRMFVYETGRLIPPRYIINFPTKRHWRGKSRMSDIESGLVALVQEVQGRGITSIAVPPLGSGLGGLVWDDVRERIEAALGDLAGVQVVVYEPTGAPATDKMAHLEKAPRMTAGRAALVGLMHRYLAGLLDPFVTLLEVHKLMYFMQEAGEPLRLDYQKGPYGPYAENLRHVLRRIEGHFVTGYADGGDAPGKELVVSESAVVEAERFLQQHPETSDRLTRVGELVDGFESPFGLELLSTVHWVASREAARSLQELGEKTYAWNERKQQFTRRQLGIAASLLAENGWIEPLAEQGLPA